MIEMIQIIAYLLDAFCRVTHVEFRRSIDQGATYEQMQVLRFLLFYFLLIMSMTYFD